MEMNWEIENAIKLLSNERCNPKKKINYYKSDCSSHYYALRECIVPGTECNAEDDQENFIHHNCRTPSGSHQ